MVADTVLNALDAIVDRIRVLFPLGLAQVLDVMTYVAVGVHYKSQETSTDLLSTALVDNFLPLLEAQPSALLEALADLLTGRIDLWIATFVNSQSSYRPEPGQRRIVVELLSQYIDNYEVPEGDIAWSDELAAQIKGKVNELDAAEQLAKALRRVAAERHG